MNWYICYFSFIARNATLTDLMKCKLTQKGMEYRGSIAKTAGDIRCQSWFIQDPVHEVIWSIFLIF